MYVLGVCVCVCVCACVRVFVFVFVFVGFSVCGTICQARYKIDVAITPGAHMQEAQVSHTLHTKRHPPTHPPSRIQYIFFLSLSLTSLHLCGMH
jgi:hypothetical protein